ncbi:hypothetical protein HG530_000664 [Fusarium avenaceum]|nr:hypothetical protein HG530_000664 [Fusarium avenaceum]
MQYRSTHAVASTKASVIKTYHPEQSDYGRLGITFKIEMCRKTSFGKLAGAAAELVDESAGEVGTENASEVGVGNAGDQSVETNLLEQETGKGVLQNRSADLLIVPKIGVLELLIKVGDGNRELVGENRSGGTGLLMLAPDSLKLKTSVVLNLELHLLDVVVDAASRLETELSLLGNEEVGSLNEVRDDTLAVLDEAIDRDKVNGGRTTTTRNEAVNAASIAKVEGVTEGSTVVDNLASGQSNVDIVAQDSVTFRRQLGDVVVNDHLAAVGEAQELLTVETLGISKDTGTIDNGGVLLVAELDLVAAQITIRTTNALDILTDGQSGHAIGVVRNTTKLGRLASEERLPPRGATGASVLSSPVDQLSSVLIRTHEDDLFLAVKVDNGVLDARGLGRQEKIKDTIDVLLESLTGTVLLLRVQQNDTLGATLRDVLVLALLCASKTIVLVEETTGIDTVSLLVTRLDNSDTATGNILESEVEAAGLGADDEEHSVEGLGVLDVGEERGVKTEAQGNLGGGEVVGLEDGIVEHAEGSENHLIVLVVDVLGDLVLESIIGKDLDG